MTGPIKRPVSLATFGGVTYDENSLVKKWVTDENGTKRYHMQLKAQYESSNTQTITVTYPAQKETNGAKILMQGTGNQGTRCPAILVKHLAYGNIEGSKDNDFFTLSGCKNTTLDISNDGRADTVYIRDS